MRSSRRAWDSKRGGARRLLRRRRRHLLLLLLALDTQSSLPSVAVEASPNATLPNRIPSFDPAVAALDCAFFFIGCFSIYLRHCSNTTLLQGGTDANFHSSIGPQGIDPKLLDTFPILQCSAARLLKFGSASSECTVCLSEFDLADKLWLLSKCNHLFHSECIDP